MIASHWMQKEMREYEPAIADFLIRIFSYRQRQLSKMILCLYTLYMYCAFYSFSSEEGTEGLMKLVSFIEAR
jgi:hypothetical protein